MSALSPNAPPSGVCAPKACAGSPGMTVLSGASSLPSHSTTWCPAFSPRSRSAEPPAPPSIVSTPFADEFTPPVSAELVPEFTPAVSPASLPEVSDEFVPEFTPEASPASLPIVSDEFVPEFTPEASEESAPVVSTLSARPSVAARPNALLMRRSTPSDEMRPESPLLIAAISVGVRSKPRRAVVVSRVSWLRNDPSLMARWMTFATASLVTLSPPYCLSGLAERLVPTDSTFVHLNGLPCVILVTVLGQAYLLIPARGALRALRAAGRHHSAARPRRRGRAGSHACARGTHRRGRDRSSHGPCRCRVHRSDRHRPRSARRSSSPPFTLPLPPLRVRRRHNAPFWPGIDPSSRPTP